MTRTRHRFHLSAVAALLPLMAACAPGQLPVTGSSAGSPSYETGQSFPVPGGGRTAVLRRSPADGSWEVAVIGTAGRAPLRGFLEARLTEVVDLGRERVAVVAGRTAECPLRHVLVPVESNRISWTAFGRCGASYDFFPDGRGLVARGEGPSGPEAWLYQDRGVRGPVPIPSAVLRGTRQGSLPEPRPPLAGREPGRGAPGLSARGMPQRQVAAPSRPSGPGAMPAAVEERPAADGPLPSMRLF